MPKMYLSNFSSIFVLKVSSFVFMTSYFCFISSVMGGSFALRSSAGVGEGGVSIFFLDVMIEGLLRVYLNVSAKAFCRQASSF